MKAKQYFEMIFWFGSIMKTELTKQQLGLVMWEIIKDFPDSFNFKNLLLDGYEKLSFKCVSIGKSHIKFDLNINDDNFTFIKNFVFVIGHRSFRFPIDNNVRVDVEYGFYGKNGKQIKVYELKEFYDVYKVNKYMKPILDNFYHDKI